MSSPSEKSIDLDSNDEPIIIAQQLKVQFHSTRKGHRETIDSYLKNLKSIADSLADNGNPVSDPDLVLQLVAGLPSPQYLPFQNRISSQYPLPDFSDACSLLYMYESLLQEQQQASRTGSDSSDFEEGNDNSNLEKFSKIVGVFNSVSHVVTTACDVWSMFRTSSTANTMGKKLLEPIKQVDHQDKLEDSKNKLSDYSQKCFSASYSFFQELLSCVHVHDNNNSNNNN